MLDSSERLPVKLQNPPGPPSWHCVVLPIKAPEVCKRYPPARQQGSATCWRGELLRMKPSKRMKSDWQHCELLYARFLASMNWASRSASRGLFVGTRCSHHFFLWWVWGLRREGGGRGQWWSHQCGWHHVAFTLSVDAHRQLRRWNRDHRSCVITFFVLLVGLMAPKGG